MQSASDDGVTSTVAIQERGIGRIRRVAEIQTNTWSQNCEQRLVRRLIGLQIITGQIFDRAIEEARQIAIDALRAVNEIRVTTAPRDDDALQRTRLDRIDNLFGKHE